jgi:hypothetical protein
MLDILLFRDEKGGNTDLVRESQRRRGGEEAVALVDEVIALDKVWRAGTDFFQILDGFIPLSLTSSI